MAATFGTKVMQWGLPMLAQVTDQDFPATSRGRSMTLAEGSIRVVGISLQSVEVLPCPPVPFLLLEIGEI